MTPEPPEEDLLPPDTDYDRQEDIDDLYGNGLEYDIVFDEFGNISEPPPIDYPTGMSPKDF